MANANVPCKVYYPRANGEPKELTASTQAELDALLRIGWKTEKPAK
jgi:hypothetical protein